MATVGADQVPEALRSEFICAVCRGELSWTATGAECESCGADFPIREGTPELSPLRVADARGLATAQKRDQEIFFDREDEEYETTRPAGAPRLHGWLLSEKFRRGIDAIGDIVEGGSVLSVCGGSGLDAEFLARAGASVVACDISAGAMSRARERARRHGFVLTTVVADAESLPFRDRSFDVVYVHDGLHHLERPFAALDEMARVARRAVSVNEPARATATAVAVRLGLSESEEESGNAIERLDPAEIERHLSGAGFDVVSARRYAMYYGHRPGPVARVLSRRRLLPAAQASFRVLDAPLGRLGNKLSVQAVRVPAGPTSR